MSAPVPNSAGTSTPRFKVPPGTCDCHLHVYDPHFPMAWPKLRATPDASVAEYRLLQQRLGTERAVVVQPAAYGVDTRGTVAAVQQLGLDRARAIAVLHPSVADAELSALHAGGVRGLRFTQHDPNTAVTSADMIEPLARRIQEMGWHTQLHLRGDQIVELQALIERLPGTLVFDHMGRLPQPEGVNHPAFRIIAGLVEAGRAWVKLSGPYLDTQVGSPRYADSTRVAREFVKLAPERMVWGSDWPHPTERDVKPDDAILLDLVQEWAREEETRLRILVENPAKLYGFA
ncbi:MAG TPA: amidohydrolase family protein [Usitatibacter sp.]|nr:amidohydrolase family protein [Usitatibacter sp.]